MRRRTFVGALIAAGLASVAAILGGRALVCLRQSPQVPAAAEIESMLRKRFAYLQFEPGAIERFAAEAETHRHRLKRRSKGMELGERFLMSTDFFQNGADESRTISYVTFYHPYESFCYNPLARTPEDRA